MTWNRYFPCWLVVSALGVPLALIVLAASPLGTNFVYVMMGMPFLLLVWAGAGMGAAVFGVHAAMRKAWWQSLIALALPLILVLAVMPDPFRIVRFCNYAGDVV